MAVMILDNLVLRGVRVACDVVTGLKGMGSNPARDNLPAMDLSHSRHLSQGIPLAGSDDPRRQDRAEAIGAAAAARAGRPGSSPGVPVRRTPAIVAGRTVLSRWSPDARVLRPIPTYCRGRFTGRTGAAGGQELAQRLQSFAARTLPRGGLLRPPADQWSGKRRKPGTAWFRPVTGGTLKASTRG